MNQKPSESSELSDQAEHWVFRLASGAISPDEMTKFEKWLARSHDHRAAFDRARTLWQSLDGYEAAFVTAPAPPRHRSRRGTWVRRHPYRLGLGAAAAALALIVAIPDTMIRLRADAIADAGQVRTLALADGSTVMLDSGAALAVAFSQTERRIELLHGAAWFDVKHGDPRPFRVAALGGVTNDVGTAFEVSRQDETVVVGVTSGVVRVSSHGTGGARIVHQFGRVRYQRGGPVESMAPGTATDMAAWRRGIIVIDNRSVAEAIAEVARYRRGLTFNLADTSHVAPVSGVFRTDAPDEALRTLAGMAGLRVTTLPADTVVLRR